MYIKIINIRLIGSDDRFEPTQKVSVEKFEIIFFYNFLHTIVTFIPVHSQLSVV